MKERSQIILLIITFSCFNIHAQVNENILMDRFNMNAFNPAYAGSEGRVLSFTTRSTWQGVSDAPKMNYFYFSGNPKNLSLGVSIIENKIFIDQRTLYSVDASYKLTVGGGNLYILELKQDAH